MSEMITDLVWYPPAFPEQGRIPTLQSLIWKNYDQQNSEENAYHQKLMEATGKKLFPPCCKTLHISLFFDGTGNNLYHDQFIADPKHPTNIARLFRATIGLGYAGGVVNRKNSELVDLPGSCENKFFKYYIPGVGTAFPEVNDPDFTGPGLAMATGGENRINWALLRLIDALRRTMGLKELSDEKSWEAVDKMSTSTALFGLGGSSFRYRTMQQQLQAIKEDLRNALHPATAGKIKLLGIKLYVYGFSRGAAAARTFVNWLSELLPAPLEGEEKSPQYLAVDDLQIPISVEFLGLLDTVASVGVAHIIPVNEGHMGWANDTQELPDEKRYGGLIKHCVHLVASHEQRLCFPLDSIRRADGHYPDKSFEVIYPGVHSDSGGGYPPGEQGKAPGNTDRNLLSQIPLNDMYAAAFEAGAPLKVPEFVLPERLRNDTWRIMSEELNHQFDIAPELAQRFNSWRTLTLGFDHVTDKIKKEDAARFTPSSADVPLEKALAEQLAWITAWRIGRYARGTYKTQRFFVDAAANGLDKDSDPKVRDAAEEARKKKQKEVDAARQELKNNQEPGTKFVLLPPGPKDFDAALNQTQLREAAEEFREDYNGVVRTPTGNWLVRAGEYLANNAVFLLNNDEEYVEWEKIKTSGESRLLVLFPREGEQSNAAYPSGQVRALFDDQVHDSRAWFMHSQTGGREMWGNYFLYRMVYFGRRCSKPMKPLMIAGAILGAATVAGSVGIIIINKSRKGQAMGLAGIMGATYLETQALDLISGKPLEMLPGAELLQKATDLPGELIAQMTGSIQERRREELKRKLIDSWNNPPVPPVVA